MTLLSHKWKMGDEWGHQYASWPFFSHELTLIPAWISNHTPSKVWDEITYPYPNSNGWTTEVLKWISNFISHFIMDVITYPCWDQSPRYPTNKQCQAISSCVQQLRYLFCKMSLTINNFAVCIMIHPSEDITQNRQWNCDKSLVL